MEKVEKIISLITDLHFWANHQDVNNPDDTRPWKKTKEFIAVVLQEWKLGITDDDQIIQKLENFKEGKEVNVSLPRSKAPENWVK